jgi:hypothetical protein
MMQLSADPCVQWVDPLSGKETEGTIIDAHYCTTRDRWQLLVAEEEGRFHNLHTDMLELRVMWFEPLPMGLYGGDDDFEDSDDSDTDD